MELSLSKLPWYGQVGAFVLLAVGGVGAFYVYYEKPVRDEMATREKQLAIIRGDIVKGQTTAKKLDDFRGQVNDLESQLGNLRAVLPDEKDAADLLRSMQTVAAQSNLTIKGFKPAQPTVKEIHAEWPIQLELEGTYHNLAIFFDRVAKFTRIVNISGLQVDGKDGKDKSRGGNTITAKCVATTFVLLDAVADDKAAGKVKGEKKPAKPAAAGAAPKKAA
jgi:type IV pilus assembly protein PilO